MVIRQVISGIAWNGLSRMVNGAFQIVFTIALARLLDPADFGLVAMVLVVTGFVGLFGDPGLIAGLIQRDALDERHISSVFWFHVATAVALSGMVALLSTPVARFYGEPIIREVALPLSLILVLNGLKGVPSALLLRDLCFFKLAIADTVTTVLAGLTAVCLAISGFGVLSLVVQILAAAAISAFLYWRLSGWQPGFRFSMRALRDILPFGVPLFGFNLFNFGAKNVDNLLIGRFIGSGGLGVYSKAYEFLVLPVNQISGAVGQVLYPALCRIKEDRVGFKALYLDAVSGIAFLAFPLMMGLLVVADDFVVTVYGAKWAAMIPILRVFCILGVIHSVASTAGWIYSAQGETTRFFRWGLFSNALVILSIALGVWVGTPFAVALCFAVVSGLIHIYPNFSIPGKLIGMTLGEVLRKLADIFFCSLFMAAGVWMLRLWIPGEWNQGIRLMISVALGVVLYVLLTRLFRVRACGLLTELVASSFKKTGGVAEATWHSAGPLRNEKNVIT